MSATIYILNGPNLNLLGTREPEIYGSTTLSDIEKLCGAKATSHGLTMAFRQTNSEGELVNWVQEASRDGVGVVINAGAYTHTSVAILDALKAVDVPIIEVHLSNVYGREAFRHVSYVSPAATGVICGLGAIGYEFAIDAIAALVNDSRTQV